MFIIRMNNRDINFVISDYSNLCDRLCHFHNTFLFIATDAFQSRDMVPRTPASKLKHGIFHQPLRFILSLSGRIFLVRMFPLLSTSAILTEKIASGVHVKKNYPKNLP